MTNSKAVSKLRNIDAIKRMLDGTHRSQTKTAVGFSDVQESTIVKRAIGEVWKDANGIEWEQRDGFKIKKGKFDEIRQTLQLQMPNNCPECGQAMTKRLDKKFWALEKHCFDCQVAFEHNLRIEGKYEAYERERILQNAQAWLKQAEQEAMEIVAAFRNPKTYVNADGTTEEWFGGMSADDIADKIENEFKLFKENFLNKLQTEQA